MKSYSLTTAIDPEPLTLEEVKIHLKIEADETTEDTLLNSLITSARIHAETYTRRALGAQTWTLYMDKFDYDDDEICISYPPLTAVNSVKYYDEYGVLITMSPTLYQVDTHSTPGRIVIAYGEVWPQTELGRINAVEIEFNCGYTDGVNIIPESIKQAMLLMIGHWYSNKESVVVGTIASKVPETSEALMWAYRDLRW